jgi:cardiolipin synthase
VLGDLKLVGVGYVILGVILTFDILLHKQRPVSAVLWLGLVWVLPYGGALAYLTFGVDRVTRGARVRAESNALVQQWAVLHPTFERPAVDESHASLPEHPAAHVFRATDPAVQPYRVLRGHRLRFLVDGDDFFPALFEDIAAARHSIHVQTFMYRRDRTGNELLDLLIERARAGVDVRLLYDRFGSAVAHYTRFFERARKAGVRIGSITQANPFKGSFQINLRNHRKVAVIDGCVGYVGGINIHDENRSEYADDGPIRDYATRFEGPAVSDLQFVFVQDWFFATREPPERLLEPNCFPPLREVGSGLMQVVPGGPEREGDTIVSTFFGAIVSAQRSLSIVTPYFVPDEPILQALRYTATRGVDVRLVVPRVSNHRYAEFAGRSLYGDLLNAGVRVYERKPPFMHAKALVVDGVYALVGSANLDYRSLHLSFETNIEAADTDFVTAVSEQIEEEIAASVEIRLLEYVRRPIVRRLAEKFFYLFQPML